MNPQSLPTELAELLEVLCLGELSQEQAARLEALLQDNPEQCRHYVRFMQMHAIAERCEGTSPTYDESALAAHLPPVMASRKSPVLGFLGRATAAIDRPVFWSILGVGLLFAGYFMAISWNMLGKKGSQQTADRGQHVARIRDSADVKWSASTIEKSEIRNLKSEITAGEPLKIDSGLVELQLKQGATLLIEGPAEWSIDGDNSATLKRGKLIAKVSRQAVGFTVVTPSAEVVDLGTEFAVEVSKSGDTDVHVIQGKVDLYRTVSDASSTHGSKTARALPAARLRAGEAARADASTPSSVAIHFQPEKFAQSLDPGSVRTKSRPTRLLDLSEAVAMQSSTWSDDIGDFSARAAVDDDPATTSHTTGEEPGQWWQVDLGRTCAVGAVVLQNRSICCGWLRDIRIKILSDDGKTVVFSSEILNPGNDEFGGPQEYQHGPEQLMLDLKRSHGKAVPGRFVRIERFACEATAELLPLDKRPSVIAAAGKAIVLSEVQVFEEYEPAGKSQIK